MPGRPHGPKHASKSTIASLDKIANEIRTWPEPSLQYVYKLVESDHLISQKVYFKVVKKSTSERDRNHSKPSRSGLARVADLFTNPIELQSLFLLFPHYLEIICVFSIFSISVPARFSRAIVVSIWGMKMAKGGRLHYQKSAGIGGRSTFTLVLAMLLMLSVVLLMLLALGIVSLPVNSRSPEGLANPVVKIVRDTPAKGDGVIDEMNEPKQWAEILSWEPRAILYHNFLSKEDCDYLISLAKPNMVKSTVVDSETGKSKDSRVRTSSGTFLNRGQDKIIRNIEKRIADFSFIPTEHGEGIQILHYEIGQKYEPHYDYFLDSYNTKNGGQRIATVLMYLSDVEKGGETVFPASKVNSSSVPWWDELSECAKAGISVRPRMGDALLFWSMRPDASLDPSSLHAGCPVIQGNKWSATKWMHVGEYKV